MKKHKRHADIEEIIGKHNVYAQALNPVVYWTALFVAIIGNIVVSVVMVPFLLALRGYALHITIIVMGFVFGLLYNLLLRDIEYVDYQHHVIAWLFIPSIALINIYMMVNVSNRLANLIEIEIHQNPVAISVLYIIAFVAPYAFSKLIDSMKFFHPKKAHQ